MIRKPFGHRWYTEMDGFHTPHYYYYSKEEEIYDDFGNQMSDEEKRKDVWCWKSPC